MPPAAVPSPSPNDIVIAGAVRTPIGKFGGALASLTAAELGAGRGAPVRVRAVAPVL